MSAWVRSGYLNKTDMSVGERRGNGFLIFTPGETRYAALTSLFIDSVLVFYCCIIHCHKLSVVNNTDLLPHSFCGWQVWAWCGLMLCSGSHWAGIKVLARAALLFWGLGASSKLILWLNSSPCGCRTEVLAGLSVGGNSQLPEASSIPYHVVHSIVQLTMVHKVLLMIWTSDLFFHHQWKLYF